MKRHVACVAVLACVLAGCQDTGSAAPQTGGSPTVHPAHTTPTGAAGHGGLPAGAAGPYRVIRVVDGDTVHVSIHGTDATLRLIGMDTPEVKDPRKPVQCYGPQASDQAHKVLDGKKIYLTYDPSQGRHDKYGRTLAYLWLTSGRSYEKWMIRRGFAHEYTYDTAYKYQAQMKAAQRYARAHHRGFWAASTCDGNTTQPAKHTASRSPTPRATHHTVATHRAKPSPVHTHPPATRRSVAVHPGAYCAADQAGKTGVSGGHVYVCRQDSAGKLRWRRPA